MLRVSNCRAYPGKPVSFRTIAQKNRKNEELKYEQEQYGEERNSDA